MKPCKFIKKYAPDLGESIMGKAKTVNEAYEIVKLRKLQGCLMVGTWGCPEKGI